MNGQCVAGDPVQAVLERLHGVKPAGRDKWSAKCPAHDDNRASLSISRGDDGRCLLHCHAGCTPEAVCQAMGLDLADLFSPAAPSGKPTARQSATPRKIVKKYPYCDESGRLLFEVVRFEPKDFRQRRPDGNGGWVWNLDGVPRVLYRLPELAKADPAAVAFIVEGEKDADNLTAIGLVATTCPQGAGKWGRLADDSALHGRRVCIILDKDTPGRKHAQDVAARLHGKADNVRILELPGDGKDVSDWLAGVDGKAPNDIPAELLALAAAAPVYVPGDGDSGKADADAAVPDGKKVTKALRDLEGKLKLGTPIEAVIQRGTEDPTFELRLVDGRLIDIGGPDVLLSGSRLQRRFMDHRMMIRRFGADVLQKIAQDILDASAGNIVHVPTAAETTADYVRRFVSRKMEKPARGKSWFLKDSADVFTAKGPVPGDTADWPRFYLRLSALEAWLRDGRHQVTQKSLAKPLQHGGWEPVKFQVFGKKPNTRRLWRSPPGFRDDIEPDGDVLDGESGGLV